MVGVLSPTPTMPPNDTLLADCMLFVIIIYFIYFLCLMYPLYFSVLWEKKLDSRRHQEDVSAFDQSEASIEASVPHCSAEPAEQ